MASWENKRSLVSRISELLWDYIYNIGKAENEQEAKDP